MTAYPQLAQFPVIKRHTLRTVVNRSADGHAVKLADPNAETVEWQLQYTDLTDQELATLETFFATAEGTLNAFTFLDPSDNLLAWSEDLANAAWQPDPLLTVTQGQPLANGLAVWQLANTGEGPQKITQTLQAPAGYRYCFSLYARANQPATATLIIGAQQMQAAVTGNWTRMVFTAADAAVFAFELPTGASASVYGMQVEAQAGASVYKPSTTGGVYQNARLNDDALAITTTGAGQHSCRLSVISCQSSAVTG